MPKKGKRKGKKGGNNGGGGNMVSVTGPGGFSLRFPFPRLPSWLGAGDRLSANAAVYPRVDLDMPITILGVVVTAGAVAQVFNVDVNTLISGWASRFANTFREYCVCGLVLEHTVTTVTAAGGLVLVFVDETLATVPNAGSLYTPHLEVPLVANPNGRSQVLKYVPSGSYTDLQWTPCSAPVVRQWVKYYANSSNTGTGATTSAQIMVRGTIALSFRGYSNF